MKWVTIKTFAHPHEAQIEKSKLESSGISVFLKNEFVQQTYNSLGFQGVELQVPEDKVVEAMQFIDHPDFIDISDAFDIDHCPYCNSEKIQRKENSIFAVFLNALGLPTSKKFHCFDCQRSFKSDETK